VSGHRFDFTSLAGKQLAFNDSSEQFGYVFTFCQPAPEQCTQQDSSLCQYAAQFTDQNNLALWSSASNWTAKTGSLNGLMFGDPRWCDMPRTSNITFTCVDGPPKFVSVVEATTCYYTIVIEVPMVVCSNTIPCCTPPTYSSTRMETDGSESVVQADAKVGNWYDSNYQGKGQSVLCAQDYDRCFTFTPTSCVSSAFRPAPVECFGTTFDWKSVKEGPLLAHDDISLTSWVSSTDGYVMTMPLGSKSSCVVVSGSKRDSSFEFSLVPNTTWWNIPKSCIRERFGN
jgi:hypothetical protein